jgi:hypothetical protein
MKKLLFILVLFVVSIEAMAQKTVTTVNGDYLTIGTSKGLEKRPLKDIQFSIDTTVTPMIVVITYNNGGIKNILLESSVNNLTINTITGPALKDYIIRTLSYVGASGIASDASAANQLLDLEISDSILASSKRIELKASGYSDSTFIKLTNIRLDTTNVVLKRIEIQDSTKLSRKVISIDNQISDSLHLQLLNTKLVATNSILSRSEVLLTRIKDSIVSGNTRLDTIISVVKATDSLNQSRKLVWIANQTSVSDSGFIKSSNVKLDTIIAINGRIEIQDSSKLSRKLITIANQISDSNFVKNNGVKIDTTNVRLSRIENKKDTSNYAVIKAITDSIGITNKLLRDSSTYNSFLIANVHLSNIFNIQDVSFKENGYQLIGGERLSLQADVDENNAIHSTNSFINGITTGTSFYHTPIGGTNGLNVFRGLSVYDLSTDQVDHTQPGHGVLLTTGLASDFTLHPLKMEIGSVGEPTPLVVKDNNYYTLAQTGATDGKLVGGLRYGSTEYYPLSVSSGGVLDVNVGSINVNQSIGSAGHEKITDGTNIVSVTVSNTSAVATNPSLVIQQNPNTQDNANYSMSRTATSAAAQNMFHGTAGVGFIDLSTFGTSTLTSANAKQWNSFTCQIIGSAGIIAGQITFEGTNEGVVSSNFVPIPVTLNNSSTLLTTPQTIVAGTSYIFKGNIEYKYIRCRISTAIAGGTISSITNFSPSKIIFGSSTITNGDIIPASTSVVATNTSQAVQLSPNGNTVKIGETVFIQSVGNSSTSQLGSGATFTGTVQNLLTGKSLIVSIVSNQPITINVIQYIDASGTQICGTSTFTRLANSPFNESIQMNGNYTKVTVQNTGASATTNLVIDTWFGDMPPFPVALTNRSNFKVSNEEWAVGSVNQINTTITTGGTAQTALTVDLLRQGFEIINTSTLPLYINFSGTATTTSLTIPSGASYARWTGKIPTNAISIIGATTGQTFTTLSIQ